METIGLLGGLQRCHVLVVMGSQSDWRKVKNAPPQKGGMAECVEMLKKLSVAHEVRIVSAHRTPSRIEDLARMIDGNIFAVIAGAGGAAHLPGMMAAHLLLTPVIGVPIESRSLKGLDSLLSIVQMPPGVPVNTMGIGGGVNAAIAAAQIVARVDQEVRKKLHAYRRSLTEAVPYFPGDDEPVEEKNPARRTKR